MSPPPMDGLGPAGPANELELELKLERVILRDFTFSLKPLRGGAVVEPVPGLFLAAVDGVELEAVAKDTGLVVSLRFDRSEFVNLATAGLTGLDVADEETGGGD